MMLSVVVLPAPLGPMTPTISHSPARRLTFLAACTPPKWMEQPCTSSTDIAHPHFRVAGVLEAEPPAPEPALDGPDLLAHATGVAGEGEQEQQRPDDDRDVLLGQDLEPRDAEPMAEQLVEVRPSTDALPRVAGEIGSAVSRVIPLPECRRRSFGAGVPNRTGIDAVRQS